ncbi:MAG: restriction endonuclease subunit S [Pontiellaceae bacterium]|nr:restriction endonuclease subunit S [Pontiellaceae bacterium]
MQIQGDFVCIPEKVDRENHKTHLRKGDIVLSKTACAAASLVTVDECNVSQDTVALKLKPKCGIRSDFLVTYFNTREGLLLLRRWFTGNIQMHLNLEDCGNIAVPAFSNDLQTKIGKLLLDGIAKREISESEFKAAQQVLLEALNYSESVHEQSASVKSFTESFSVSGRLDAEFYQPKFDELFKRIHQNAEYVKTVSEIAGYIERGCVAQYDESGSCKMITQKHLTETEIDYENLDKTTLQCWEANESAQVRQNDILVYSTGANVGRTQAYLSNERALACQDIVTIRQGNEDPIYVACVMNSLIGRLQTEKFKSGCAQPHLYPKDISQFVIPFVSKEKQQEIVDRLLEAREKKAESYHLLEKAKRAVEIAIEKGEEAAMAYLDGKSYVAQTITQDLAQKAPYFSIDAVRDWLAEQKMSYKPDTVKSYLSRQQKEGKIFDAGRGWYSSIAEPYRLDTAPVEKLVGELKTAFPLLEFACWSTAQLNEMLRHQLAKHVQLAYVERDAIGSVADWLRSHGYRAYANPGKAEIRKTFSIEGNTVVVLPLTTKSPQQNGYAMFEKIMVDVLADIEIFSIMNIPEFIDGASGVIQSQRIDMAELIKYSTRRNIDISRLEDGFVIH